LAFIFPFHPSFMVNKTKPPGGLPRWKKKNSVGLSCRDLPPFKTPKQNQHHPTPPVFLGRVGDFFLWGFFLFRGDIWDKRLDFFLTNKNPNPKNLFPMGWLSWTGGTVWIAFSLLSHPAPGGFDAATRPFWFPKTTQKKKTFSPGTFFFCPRAFKNVGGRFSPKTGVSPPPTGLLFFCDLLCSFGKRFSLILFLPGNGVGQEIFSSRTFF